MEDFYHPKGGAEREARRAEHRCERSEASGKVIGLRLQRNSSERSEAATCERSEAAPSEARAIGRSCERRRREALKLAARA